MKIGFVHDRIYTLGGAEKVFKDLIESNEYTKARIFCYFSDKKYLKVKNQKIRIVTPLGVFINKFFVWATNSNIKLLKRLFDYRNLITFLPVLNIILSIKIKIYNPDRLVVSSFAGSKNISFKGPKTLYLHSPMQYIYSHYDENISKLTPPISYIYKIVCKYLKKWDQFMSKNKNFDKIYSNSIYTQKLTKKIYNRDSEVRYPKISNKIINTPVYQDSQDYYIFIGRIVKFSKQLETIIKAFNQSGKKLVVLGDGPDKNYLTSIAKSNIIFTGYISDEKQKVDLLKKSKALINITKESFGMVTAESLSLGVPVIGYSQGASKYLINHHNGLFVKQRTVKNLKDQIAQFEKLNYDKNQIKQNFIKKYKKFSRD